MVCYILSCVHALYILFTVFLAFLRLSLNEKPQISLSFLNIFYNLKITYAIESKIKNYDGSGEVKVFLEKTSLHSALKGFDGEKAALYLASKLEGRAFDIYRRLSPEDKKNENKIRAELLKEFERGHQGTEQAMYTLENRHQKEDESAHSYAYHILELVKIGIPEFPKECS